MEAIVTAGAGFLLAVLWFDLMFDVQVRKRPVRDEAVQSIATYYRRVTTDARPMNRLVALAMLVTLGGIVTQIVTGHDPKWPAWVSLPLVLTPMVIAATRTVPNAVALGARAGEPVTADDARVARRVLADHRLCFLLIASTIAVQTIGDATA